MARVTTGNVFLLFWKSPKSVLKVVKLSLFLFFPPLLCTFFSSWKDFAEPRISHLLYIEMPVKIEKIIEPNVYLWVVSCLKSPVSLCRLKWVRTGCSLWNSVNYRAFNPITLDSPSLNVFASHSLREVLRQFDPNVNELHAVTRLSCSDFELSIIITTSVL